jgi:hypothetical protein
MPLGFGHGEFTNGTCGIGVIVPMRRTVGNYAARNAPFPAATESLAKCCACDFAPTGNSLAEKASGSDRGRVLRRQEMSEA